jgi:hypothetical protein
MIDRADEGVVSCERRGYELLGLGVRQKNLGSGASLCRKDLTAFRHPRKSTVRLAQMPPEIDDDAAGVRLKV